MASIPHLFCWRIIRRRRMLSTAGDEAQECAKAFSSEVDTGSREENA
jgi:hypothetical protein